MDRAPGVASVSRAVLGISAFYHDAAAALVVDGQLVAAAQEERFTRTKHDASAPTHAVAYCLEQAGLRPDDVNLVAFYDKPLLKFDRIIETFMASAPRGYGAFARALPGWLRDKLFLQRRLARTVGPGYRRRFVFAEHHESHAASAFFPSPFEQAAVLTFDGVGEWATASFGTGRDARLSLTHELTFPHSLGLLYSAFTAFCGFRVNSGEYKLMGLAPYGKPRFAERILEALVDLGDDGSFRLDQRYFSFGYSSRSTTKAFDDLFDGPGLPMGAEPGQREADLAASVQWVTEEIVLRAARHVHRTTGMSRLCMAGGVALNSVANGRLVREGPFDEVWVQPAAGDAGGAVGVALLAAHQLLGEPRRVQTGDGMARAALGPGFTDEEAAATLKAAGAHVVRFDDDISLCDAVAEQLDRGHTVGWFAGRMEFGPRALGGRSILADPRRADMKERLNAQIKFREPFRPFAPSVLVEKVGDFFELGPAQSPYMLLVGQVREDAPVPIPAVTHVDGSARVQTVDPGHGRFRLLLEAFERRTGCAVVVNTSFNVRGEPIVCTPQDAWRCFTGTGLDVLVVERCLVLRSEQSPAVLAAGAAHAQTFRPD